MRKFLLVVSFCLFSSLVNAQAAQVIFDYPNTSPAATVQGWTATLYVNGTPFVLTDTCVLTTAAPIVVRCTATFPNVTSALTPSGVQNFEVTLMDVVLESAKSSPPFVLTRPSVVTNLRIQ